MSGRVWVLDASALLSGMDLGPILAAGDAFTTSGVLSEVARGRAADARDALLERGLAVREPSAESLVRVADAARGTGDEGRLSVRDREVLALALELGAVVVTDDYSMQNTARVLGVPFQALAQRGAVREFTYVHRCQGCRRTFDAPQKDCPVCGSAVRTVRKPSHGAGRKG